MRQPLKAPPFANIIDGADELVMIYCGPRAWQLGRPAQDRVASLVFPRKCGPSEYRWPVKDKRVLIFSGGEPDTILAGLAMELLHQHARCVHVRYSDGRIVDYDLQEAA